ncbi:MAG: PH domain-containing protein [Acidimicrobiales bacterium]
MPLPRGHLNAEEEIVLDLRPHWWFFSTHLAVITGLLVLGFLALLFSLSGWIQGAVAVALVVVLLFTAWRYLRWTTTSFVITTDRLIDRSGIFHRSGIEIPLDRVNTVFFKQSFFERLIGSGDLVIESAGERGAQTVVDIPNPTQAQNEIYRQMEANENRKFDRAAGGRTGEPSIPAQIEKLAELHRSGVLTDAEFHTKKQQLLDRM